MRSIGRRCLFHGMQEGRLYVEVLWLLHLNRNSVCETIRIMSDNLWRWEKSLLILSPELELTKEFCDDIGRDHSIAGKSNEVVEEILFLIPLELGLSHDSFEVSLGLRFDLSLLLT